MVSSTRSDVAGIGESDALNAGLSGDERRTLARALDFAASVYGEKLLGTGEPAYGHAIGLARNVAELRLDADARVAGLLFSVPEYLSDGEEKLAASFGAAVASLVAGISRLNSLRMSTRTVAMGKDSQSQAEVLRKMLLAMVEDIRVVLLRLASRTQTLRWLSRGPEAGRRELARETLDIYAPLANRLGVWQLKWELEDLSFRYLEPELYQRIAGMLEDRRSERERSVEHAIAELADELAGASIRGEITGRPKHLYSIYSKMRAKSLDFSEIHDVSGLRVLVDSVADCYTALGVVHNLWAPIPREFDDYISRPKANLYRSLHTAVIGPEGKALEVQIRTREMHRDAELGVAAHWRYKEGAKRGKGDPFDEKIAWLRQMLAWRDEIVDASDWVEQSKRAVLDDTVYVLTPQRSRSSRPSPAARAATGSTRRSATSKARARETRSASGSTAAKSRASSPQGAPPWSPRCSPRVPAPAGRAAESSSSAWSACSRSLRAAASRRRRTGSRASSPRGAGYRCTGATARASRGSSSVFRNAASARSGAAARARSIRWTSSCAETTVRGCCAT